jgi:hypothetical protein
MPFPEVVGLGPVIYLDKQNVHSVMCGLLAEEGSVVFTAKDGFDR